MKAVRYHQCGGPEVLRWEDAPDPVAGPGQVVLRVEAAGVNFADSMRRSGLYHFKSEFPAYLGTEAAGMVSSVGTGVSNIKIGDRVLCRTAAAGCQAELARAQADEVLPMPASLSFVEAASLPVVFLSAYHLLKTLAPLRAGETVLIHAAASGVGTAAVQLAKLWGARVFATASTDEKLALARELGAEEGINYVKADFVAAVMRWTQDIGVDRVLECVGGEVLTKSVAALAPGGRLMIYGRASGKLPDLSPDQFFAKNLQLYGLNIGGKPWTQAVHRVALEEILGLVATRAVRPVISEIFPMARVADAHRALADRKTMGKIILVPKAG